MPVATVRMLVKVSAAVVRSITGRVVVSPWQAGWDVRRDDGAQRRVGLHRGQRHRSGSAGTAARKPPRTRGIGSDPPPVIRPWSVECCSTRAKIASCISGGSRERVRLSQEWSGTGSVVPSRGNSHKDRLPPQRHAHPPQRRHDRNESAKADFVNGRFASLCQKHALYEEA